MLTVVPSWHVVFGFNSLTKDERVYEFYAMNHIELLQILEKIKLPFDRSGITYITITRTEN